MTIKILDCTLRDGGYYNKWDFSKDLISDYLESMAICEIDFVELGFRQFKNDTYLGPHAYTTAKYLERLNLPDGPTYGVMIDAKTILSENQNQEECIDLLFDEAKKEKIDLVRVAAYFEEVPLCLPMLQRLKEKGYTVGLNIMQISLREPEEIEELTSLVSKWSCIDVLYFADSLGAMLDADIKKTYKAISNNWSKDIGFHAHNNLGKAVSNVNKAIELGASWIDSTISGMGRGAGNAETEFLLLDPILKKHEVNHSNLFSLVNNHFDDIKKSYGWGTTYPYYLGALNKIHPTYVQELCADESLDKNLIPKIIKDLGELPNPASFDAPLLRRTKSKIDTVQKKIDGKPVSNFMIDKEVLLIAQTDLSVEYMEAIKDYCLQRNPILISINQPKENLKLEYDLVIISHNEKFREDEKNYVLEPYNYVAPKAMFEGLDINIVHDYGIHLVDGKFENHGSFACLPNRLTLAYAISFCLDAGAKELNLVGFGGFNLDEKRHKEVQEFLQILAREKSISLFSLTPTSFSIKEKSIYAI